MKNFELEAVDLSSDLRVAHVKKNDNLRGH